MTLNLIPARETRAEIEILKSRFIACASPAFSVDEARAYISKIKAEYPDATHHVPAFLIGRGASVTAHCSDDREPSGTAGRPMLAVLQGSGLGDVVVVVVRYFGGTKLGTGGLVRAYGDAVKEVLAALPRAQKVATQVVMLVAPYSLFERIKILIENAGGVVMDTAFEADVTFVVQFRQSAVEGFQKALVELSNGQVSAEIIETNPETIFPVND